MISSDPSKRLMGKKITVYRNGHEGVIRAYSPLNGKWWVVVTPINLAANGWYGENELEVHDES